MVYLIKEIISHLESIAPPSYQEGYDNSGLIVGDPEKELTGILCSLDVTEEVVIEAREKNCNLIISHHPIIFKGLKSLTGKNHVERTVILAIQNGMALYAIHTNLDHVHTGVNKKIADKIGLNNVRVLAPKKGLLTKLITFIPLPDTEMVLKALYEAGAGVIGNYAHCSFKIEGEGTFLPTKGANPYLGKHGEEEKVNENRIEIMFPSYLKNRVIRALKIAHPYEEVAYYLQGLDNENQEVGAGMIGTISQAMDEKEFLIHLKRAMGLNVIRHTRLLGKKIRNVALCGGAGIFLLPQAKMAGADIFITADVKYHEFFDAESQLVITDIGHYESEIYTKELLKDILSQKFSNIALYLTNIVTNPISYL
ncbi:MAG: Nif3-like dinuclear metal center hexameric protein [Cyclobacteriaceae bacterium]